MERLEELARILFDARQAEANAKALRIQSEEEIANLIETGENGSKTVAAGEGLKVTVKRALTYVADVPAIRGMEDIPGEVMPLTQTSPIPAGYVFDHKAYDRLREDHPDVFKKVSEHVTTKPKKTSVTLKLA